MRFCVLQHAADLLHHQPVVRRKPAVGILEVFAEVLGDGLLGGDQTHQERKLRSPPGINHGIHAAVSTTTGILILNIATGVYMYTFRRNQFMNNLTNIKYLHNITNRRETSTLPNPQTSFKIECISCLITGADTASNAKYKTQNADSTKHYRRYNDFEQYNP